MYLFSVFLFFNFSSPFIFWIWLELNMIIFIGLMVSSKFELSELDIFSQSIYYFILQSFFSILLLITFSAELFKYNDLLMLAVISMKMGLFPFHFWLYKISEYLSSMNLFFILNIQKIPLLLFMMTYQLESVTMLIFINMIFGGLFLLSSKTMVEFLVSSSICFLSWLVFILVWSLLGFLLFFSKYLLFNFILINLKKLSNHFEIGYLVSMKIIFLACFLMGLPMFLYFFFKLYILSMAVNYGGAMIVFSMWVFSYLCLISYFNMLLFYMFKFNSNYNSMNKFLISDWILILSILLSFTMYT